MNGVSVVIGVDEGAFLSALPGAFQEWLTQAFHHLDQVADEVVDNADELVARRTGALEMTIHRGPLILTSRGAEIVIVAGDGTRYAIFQEFGTYKMRAHPFFRPALAMAAGGLRAGGYAARTVTTSQTRAAARRAAHRTKLRRAVKKKMLTSAQAKAESRRVSGIRRFKG